MTLQLTNISLQYPGATSPALNNISCQIKSGQRIALLGENGCGKSTLAKVMCGLIEPDSGDVILNGKPLGEAWNGIGLLFQNPDEQLMASSVENELAWGLENLAMPPEVMIERIEAALVTFDLTDIRDTPPEHLSDGQKQLVALASVVVMKPDFLILDEVTAFLDPNWKDQILEKILSFSSKMGILWISTRSDENTNADEIWLMKDGLVIDKGNPESILTTEKLENTGLTFLQIRSHAGAWERGGTSKIEVIDLCFSYTGMQSQVLKNFNCSISAGQITALIGPSASGKSTLGKILKGFHEPISGKIEVRDQDSGFTAFNAKNRLKQIGWAGAHPEVQIFAPTVWEEVGFAPANQGLKGSDLENRILGALEYVGLDVDEFRGKNPMSLSGGEKRRVALAGVIAMNCQWFIFDEPTAGLDYKGIHQIIELTNRLKGQGCGLVWISHDLNLVDQLADSVLEMNHCSNIR